MSQLFRRHLSTLHPTSRRKMRHTASQNAHWHKAAVCTTGFNVTGVHSAASILSLQSSVTPSCFFSSFMTSEHLDSIWQVFCCWLSLLCGMFSHHQQVDIWGKNTTEVRVLCWCSVESGPVLQQGQTGTCAEATWDQGSLRNPSSGCKEN